MDHMEYLAKRPDYRLRSTKYVHGDVSEPSVRRRWFRDRILSQTINDTPTAAGYLKQTIDRPSRWSARQRRVINERLSKSRFHNDYGSEFFSITRTLDGLSPRVEQTGNFEYSAPIFPTREARDLAIAIASPEEEIPLVKSPNALSRANLNWFGSTAMERTRPSDPSVSLAVSVGELMKDGLPSLIGANLKKDGLRGAGGEYLNYQFGISPIISDIQSLKSTVAEAEQQLYQWYRDSNRVIRRRYSFEPVMDHQIIENDFVVPSYMVTPHTSTGYLRGDLTIHRTIKREVWFSGAWIYRIPNFESDFAKTFAEFNRLYGLMPSIGSMWQIAPWSWLVDWQLNTRHIARNLSNGRLDRLVLLRGYVMSKTTVSERQVYKSRATAPQYSTATITTVVKQRSKAQPYGIGWKPGMELSPYQLSILAALGISKR